MKFKKDKWLSDSDNHEQKSEIKPRRRAKKTQRLIVEDRAIAHQLEALFTPAAVLMDEDTGDEPFLHLVKNAKLVHKKNL